MNIHDMTEQAYKNGHADGVKSQQKHIDKLIKENENWRRLYRMNAHLMMSYDDKVKELRKKLQTAKPEARKEFAERLKEHKHECGCNYRKKPVYAIMVEKIDNLLEEMEKDNVV